MAELSKITALVEGAGITKTDRHMQWVGYLASKAGIDPRSDYAWTTPDFPTSPSVAALLAPPDGWRQKAACGFDREEWDAFLKPAEVSGLMALLGSGNVYAEAGSGLWACLLAKIAYCYEIGLGVEDALEIILDDHTNGRLPTTRSDIDIEPVARRAAEELTKSGLLRVEGEIINPKTERSNLEYNLRQGGGK